MVVYGVVNMVVYGGIMCHLFACGGVWCYVNGGIWWYTGPSASLPFVRLRGALSPLGPRWDPVGDPPSQVYWSFSSSTSSSASPSSLPALVSRALARAERVLLAGDAGLDVFVVRAMGFSCAIVVRQPSPVNSTESH